MMEGIAVDIKQVREFMTNYGSDVWGREESARWGSKFTDQFYMHT